METRESIGIRTRQTESNERIGRLETSVEGLHSELNEIRLSLRGIVEQLSKSKEVNWSVILAGIAMVGSIYAAAIRPLATDIDRIRSDISEINRVNTEQTRVSSNNREDVTKLLSEIRYNEKALDQIYTHGSPITDKRLSLLENGVVYKPKETK